MNRFFSAKILDEKALFRPFVELFAKVNILWIILYGIIVVLDAVTGVRATYIASFSPDYVNYWSIVVRAAFVIIMYYAIISYATGSISRALRVGLRIKTLGTVATVAVVIYVIEYLLSLLPSDLEVGFGLLALGLLTWGRVVLYREVGSGLRG